MKFSDNCDIFFLFVWEISHFLLIFFLVSLRIFYRLEQLSNEIENDHKKRKYEKIQQVSALSFSWISRKFLKYSQEWTRKREETYLQLCYKLALNSTSFPLKHCKLFDDCWNFLFKAPDGNVARLKFVDTASSFSQF